MHIVKCWEVCGIGYVGADDFPTSFCWIELWAVGRYELYLDVAEFCNEVSDARGFVITCIVEDKNIFAFWELFYEPSQECLVRQRVKRIIPFVVELFAVDQRAKKFCFFVAPEKDAFRFFAFEKPNTFVNGY